MSPYTITVTFGTRAENASSSTACESLALAVMNAARVARETYGSPVMSIKIEAGDHAPRLRNGSWVDAPADGWPLAGEFLGRVA